MLTANDVKKISRQIAIENGMADDHLSEDIIRIVYCADVFECGGSSVIDRHIDIEYSFGEYYEVRENASLFPFICTICGLPLLQEETKVIIYQKEEA